MVSESYPCYVRIGESVDSEEIMELPTEGDGRILLTTITAQFPEAIGLRFKSESGSWRGVRMTGDAFDPPLEGWGYNDYIISIKKAAEKRKVDDDAGPAVSRAKKDLTSDLIVLGLPYSTTVDEMRQYFQSFGEVSHCEIKSDQQTNRSRGFGFIRFTSEEVSQTVLDSPHSLGGRKLEVRFPDAKPKNRFQDSIQTKLFIGRLPSGTTVEDLRELFDDYGPLKDVYIPQNFRGFGFVTFASQQAANIVMNSTFQLKGNYLNISLPSPKEGDTQGQSQQYGGGYSAILPGNIIGLHGGNMALQGLPRGVNVGVQGGSSRGMGGYGGGYGGEKSGGYYYSGSSGGYSGKGGK